MADTTITLEETEAGYAAMVDKFGEFVHELHGRGAPLTDATRVKLADMAAELDRQGERLQVLRDKRTVRELEAQLDQ